MDVARASDHIDALIERRARERGQANAEEMAWKASVREHLEQLRRERRAEWFCYWSALASPLRLSAEEFERRAEALPEEPAGEGG